jgi:hypothetical protein
MKDKTVKCLLLHFGIVLNNGCNYFNDGLGGRLLCRRAERNFGIGAG